MQICWEGGSVFSANQQIDPFVCDWGRQPLTKQGRKFLHAAFEGTNTALERRRALFETPKIIVAKMALKCEAFLDEDGEFAGLDVNAVYAPVEPYSLKFLLGYMHSDIATFCHRLFFKGLAMAGGYLPFQAPHLRVLPVPDLDIEEGKILEQKIEGYVEGILEGAIAQATGLDAINRVLADFYLLDESDLAAIREVLRDDGPISDES